MQGRRGKVNIIKKKEKDIRLGSVVSWYGDTYIIIWDKAFNAYKFLNIETGEVGFERDTNLENFVRDDKIKLISNEIDIIIK